MEDNHVGSVVVHDGKQLVGIVTDRDLALQLVSDQLDPLETKLAEITMASPAVIGAGESVQDAACLMRDRHVRRLPIVDGTELVGMITLDDLIVDQCVEPTLLADVVRSQLSEPARLKPADSLQPKRRPSAQATRTRRAAQRHAAHVQRSYRDLLARVMSETGLDSPVSAEIALDVVVSGLIKRVSADEARQFLAQLPCLLRERMAEVAKGPDRNVTRVKIAQELANRLTMSSERALGIVYSVCIAVGACVSGGELDDLRSQLPPEMRSILAAIAVD
jgi:uncharacterized protein (DUF2267 family)